MIDAKHLYFCANLCAKFSMKGFFKIISILKNTNLLQLVENYCKVIIEKNIKKDDRTKLEVLA